MILPPWPRTSIQVSVPWRETGSDDFEFRSGGTKLKVVSGAIGAQNEFEFLPAVEKAGSDEFEFRS